VPAFAAAAAWGGRIRAGGAETTFDFTHLDDVVDGVVGVIELLAEDDSEGTAFEVPLSGAAIAILKAVIPKGAEPDAYVFAGQWSQDHAKPLGQNAVLHVLQVIYPGMTTHGCRSSFRIGRAMKPTSSGVSPKWHWLTRSVTKWSKPTGAGPR